MYIYIHTGGEGSLSPDEVAAAVTQDVLERFGEKRFDTEDIGRYEYFFLFDFILYSRLYGWFRSSIGIDFVTHIL
jgi:hypothetical protein